jgi:hypothetical protein
MRVRYHHGTSTLLAATVQTVRFMYRLGNICDTAVVETSMRLWRWIAGTITCTLARVRRALTCWNPCQGSPVPLGALTATAGTLAYSAIRGHIAHSHGMLALAPWPACQRSPGVERVTVALRGVAARGWPARGDVSAWMPGPPGPASRVRVRSHVGAYARD